MNDPERVKASHRLVSEWRSTTACESCDYVANHIDDEFGDDFGDDSNGLYGPEEPTSPGLRSTGEVAGPVAVDPAGEVRAWPRLVVATAQVCYICGMTRSNAMYERSEGDSFPCCRVCAREMGFP